jgi:CoA:oxalate CoA-transferase
VQHRGVLVEVPPGSGVRYVGAPFHMSGTDLRQETTPPRLGEHSAEILEAMGRSTQAVDALRQLGVI